MGSEMFSYRPFDKDAPLRHVGHLPPSLSVSPLLVSSPGKPLGCGAFGKVMQASAFGIDNDSCSTVAVKMLKGA